MIHVLDQDTINQIAAGEVIERPASVVKELMENAIDARATAVTVETRDGGISLIRVTDNGCGIAKEDIPLAFLSHATSKIRSAEDLVTVSSLGFRGEALSSIASVAQIELITKTSDSLAGNRYQIEGGQEKELQEVGAPDGTTFLVRNLFYNTPVRKKFLKTAMTEGAHVADLVEKIALSHPELSVRLIQNGQNKLHTSGNHNLKDMIYTIYGREIASHLMAVESRGELVSVKGYVGKPVIARSNRNFELYFINGRYIRNPVICKAIEEAYRPFMMQHKYPFTLLYVTVEPEFLDVNVHPTKMELRFRDGELMFRAVRDAIAGVLANHELIPEIVTEEEEQRGRKRAEPASSNAAAPEKSHIRAAEPLSRELLTDRVAESRINYKSDMTTKSVAAPQAPSLAEEKGGGAYPKHLTASYPDLHVNPELTALLTAAPSATPSGDLSAESSIAASAASSSESSIAAPAQTPEKKEDGKTDPQPEFSSGEQMELFGDKLLEPKSRSRHRLIGQLFDTYWMVEFGDQLYIIDQHAAHEKVLYEKTMSTLKTREHTCQQIHPPIILTLGSREALMLENHKRIFSDIGFEIEHFGGREYAVRGVPDNLFSIAKKDLLLELLDHLSEEALNGNTDLIYEKVASMSCRAAVKGNHAMSFAEADELIEKLLELENPYACPHGRPTIISMSKYEIEKKFKRIV
ncbi:MAG: DNA mismatch repair endonuclease MutL [Clostridiales bacterium]|nr:DNA mismatch repair endonuclease MutL [Clostridiales bacterium]